MLFLDFENRPFVVPENEREMSNLFFAAISILLGNSVAISYLFSRPQNALSRRNPKRGRIFNDQGFLGLNFIYWFTKMWFLFSTFVSLYFGPSFIIELFWPSLLIIVVLYFESWKTLSLVIKKSRWKIMGLHLLVCFCLTVCLSQLDVINYKKIDNSYYAAHPTVDVPSSDYKDEDYLKRYYDNLVFKIDFDSKGEVCVLSERNKPMDLNDIYSYVTEWRSGLVEELQPRATPRLRANKMVPIRFIKEFEFKMYQIGQLKIIYEIENENEITKYLFNNQIKHPISPSLHTIFPRKLPAPPTSPYYDFIKEERTLDTIRIDVSKKVMLNDIRVSYEELVKKFKKHINRETVFEYVYDDEALYQDYINVLSCHNEAILELKKAHSNFDYEEMILEIDRNPFSRNRAHSDELWRLKREFPIQITERFK
ncbi:hypothetical protein [Winogradskyella tangerina]|uniref:hypothetical protein n=1 Tax=Winogradskyella tangerina TaxID=2023240 RepID=UPI001300B4B4|nr:hypothetical protein [Winogradskyella tangerina]